MVKRERARGARFSQEIKVTVLLTPELLAFVEEQSRMMHLGRGPWVRLMLEEMLAVQGMLGKSAGQA